MKPKFINADMYLDYWGEDLRGILKDKDSPSNKVDTDLARVELRVMSWIDKYTFRNVPWDRLTPFQIKNFQYALLEQAYYMFNNGDIAQDSGYDQSRGKIIDKGDKDSIVICDPCINFLTSAGLFNLKIANRKRWLGTGGTFYTFDRNNAIEDAGVINKDNN